ncbi:branched-chain amino acid ABC transporter permease [Rhizobium rhizogenes]|uniref:branched-chain amino acid ABC transporter permease n=1 Tax=Rhizobium rhizogenes TaxID=359 RepID=UPI0015717AB4|nr:branched-chain amino acid ABC transporter permease [Rhizobium rhizogenes]NTH22890.1 branched-chain amino acid ABC transporter permease [Rhizobium rhizogenes]NTH35919.1 branched-chain amino acid ABC transporter permease [Rhizobium rhizogenes]
MTGYLISFIPLVGINVILALALNVVAGFCGQISLGQAAFFGVGAYCTGLLALAGWPIWLTMPAVAVASGVAGAVVGLVSLRVKDDFLAVTTIAVNFLFLGVVRKSEFLGGETGLADIPAPGFGPFGFAVVILAVVALFIVMSLYLKKSWLGFGFSALAADEAAARAIAIPVPAYKLAAFFIGSAMSGIAGFLYCYYARFIAPDSFDYLLSVTILSMVVIGGIGSVAGVTAGAVLLTALPELVRFAGDYRQLVFGALLLLVVRFCPGGIAKMLMRVSSRERLHGGPTR